MSRQTKFISIIIGAMVLLIIIISIVFFFMKKNDNSHKVTDQSTVGAYTDPGSGETIYNPPNKAPEDYKGSTAAYLGFSKLLDIGLTDVQLDALKSYFAIYSAQQKKPFTEISLDVSSLTQNIDQDTGMVTVTFIVTFNRTTTEKAVVTYDDITNVTLELYSQSDSSLVYSSLNRGD